MTLVLILSHLLTGAFGALVFAAYVTFLHAAASWSDEDDDRRENLDLPTPSDPPSSWKRLPIPETPSATPSSSPAPAAGPTASAPAVTTLPELPIPTSAKPAPAPLPPSSSPASSAPPSAAPEVQRPRSTAVLLDGPLDGLAVALDPTRPARFATSRGRHLYVPTDRFDLNRRVFLHIGPDPLS
jgi:hypothetical protein